MAKKAQSIRLSTKRQIQELIDKCEAILNDPEWPYPADSRERKEIEAQIEGLHEKKRRTDG